MLLPFTIPDCHIGNVVERRSNHLTIEVLPNTEVGRRPVCGQRPRPRSATPAALTLTPAACRGIDPIWTFKARLSSLKGGVRVAIDHTHTHKGEPGVRPGTLRTSLNGGYASDGRNWT